MKLYRINKLVQYGKGEEDLLLKITPAQFEHHRQVVMYSDISEAEYLIDSQIPVYNAFGEKEDELNFQEAIEKGTPKPKLSRSNKIEIVLYGGIIRSAIANYFSDFGTMVYCPFSYIDYSPEFQYIPLDYQNSDDIQELKQMHQQWLEAYYQPVAKHSLRLITEKGIVKSYQHIRKINTDYQYVFTFNEMPNLTVYAKYLYNGRIYIPIKFEQVCKNTETLIKGYFVREN